MIRAQVIAVPGQNMLGVLITQDGKELYFQTYRDTKDKVIAEGDFVFVEKTITLGKSVIRPTELKKLSTEELLVLKKGDVKLRMKGLFQNVD